MPTYPIQLKRNGTAAATPSSLLHGEVALNYADGKLFWKDASNVIQSFTFQAYATSSSPAFTGAATFANTGNVVPLTITNTGTANSFVVNDESGDTTPFVVDAAGRVVIGATSAFSDAHKFAILGGLPSSSGVTVGFIVRASIPSTTTSNYISYFSNVQTDAASFTLASLEHYAANQQGTFSAGSSVTSQYGFVARSSLTGATNNYGFFSDIASGTGRWNFYSNGTAPSYFGGQLLVTAGSGSSGSYKPGVAVNGDDDTGLQQVGGAGTISIVTQGSERVRVDASGNVGIGAAPGTTLDIQRASADAAVFVQGQTSSTGATLQLYSGAGLGYVGTRNNYPLLITSNNAERMRVKTTGAVRFVPLSADPSTGNEAGDVYYNSSTNKLRVYNGTSWVDLH